jgi:hypothetical protein
MPLTPELRTDAWRLFLMIKERDMPSNNTAERLQQRTGIPLPRVLAALNLLWSDDAGLIRVDTDRRTGVCGYYADPKAKKKAKQDDLETLYTNWQEVMEDEDDADEWAEVPTPRDDEDDSEWNEMDEPLEEDEDEDGE